MAYHLLAGDAIGLGLDGGCGFPGVLEEDSRPALRSLEILKERLKERELKLLVLTAHSS